MDGSSNYSEKWGVFTSVGVAWRILEENFASGLSEGLSEFKIRASYGVTGSNRQIFIYASDPDLKWEETVSANIGVDAGFLKGRLTTSIDFYNKNDKDLLSLL